MSARTTADIVADLRRVVTRGGDDQFIVMLTAADRLAELDARPGPVVLGPRSAAAIVEAVRAHAEEHSPVSDDIRNFCRYLIEVTP